MANRTIALVPAARLGRLGIHRHNHQAPTQVESACATFPATSAQYPHPAQARRIDTTTETKRETISFAEVKEKNIARLRSAKCWTESVWMKMVMDMATLTCATRASP